MTTNENTDSGSNVTAFNVLSGLPQMSLFDDLDSLRPLADSALAASGVLSATDFSSGANAIAADESSTPVANAAIAAMDIPSLLKSTTGVRNSALAANGALGTMDTPAFHDAVSSVGGITASINAVTDFEQSIGTFGSPSTLAGAANCMSALNVLNSFETATSPFLAGIDAEMGELANQTGFAPLFSNDSVSRLALLTTDYDLSDVLSSHGEYTESSVDRDFEWSVAKCVYHSVRLNLEQVGIPIDEKLARDLYILSIFSSVLVVMDAYTPFSLTINGIMWFIFGQMASEYRNQGT